MSVKHTFIFLLLLALILSIGYYSAGFSELSFKNEEKKSIQVSRDDVNIDTIKFSGSESGFDPMSIIETDTSPVKDFNYRLNTDFAAAYIAVFSHYDPQNYYLNGVELPIEEAMQVSSNGYVYLNNYRYINQNGEERCLDCILTTQNFSIIYVRFRSPDKNESDSKQAKKALERINSIYEEAVNTDINIEEFYSHIYESVCPSDNEDAYTMYLTSEYTDFESVYNRLDYITSLSMDVQMPSNPLMFYWANSLRSLLNDFYYTIPDEAAEEYYVGGDSYLYGGDIYINGTSDALSLICYGKPYEEPQYTVSGNSILQTIPYRQKELIIMYSITDGNIEGFFCPSTGGPT